MSKVIQDFTTLHMVSGLIKLWYINMNLKVRFEYECVWKQSVFLIRVREIQTENVYLCLE